MEQDHVASLHEVQIYKVVDETLKNIAKIEVDIRRLPERGVLQLNYNVPDTKTFQQKMIAKDIEKLKGVIEDLKSGALVKADQITSKLPSDEKNKIKQIVVERLYPKERNENFAYEKKEIVSVGNVQKDSVTLQKDEVKSKENTQSNRSVFLSKFVAQKSKPELEKNSKNNFEEKENFLDNKTNDRKNFSNFLQYKPDTNPSKNPTRDKEER